MKKALSLLAITIFFCLPTFAFERPNDALRFQTLTKEVRCLVCQNQNIADSNAPLANDLREKIAAMINQQQSDAEIKAYLVKRYGEFILLNPRFNQTTFFLWLFPFLGLIIIVFLLLSVQRQAKL